MIAVNTSNAFVSFAFVVVPIIEHKTFAAYSRNGVLSRANFIYI